MVAWELVQIAENVLKMRIGVRCDHIRLRHARHDLDADPFAVQCIVNFVSATYKPERMDELSAQPAPSCKTYSNCDRYARNDVVILYA